jgi:hydrogenase maturation protein HypF
VARRRYVFRGTIQGVGFRPAVFRAASRLGLAGFVQNRKSEVVAEVEGEDGKVRGFPSLLAEMLPPAARIERVETLELEPSAGQDRPPGFHIIESEPSEYLFPPIAPDMALCADCARELLDPSNRRYLYPFITCTQCGPRYSIVENTPFDRANTSMRPFAQCGDCLREYSDPEDRRFHSQTNSCPVCGPKLSCTDPNGRAVDGEPLMTAITALHQGKIVALQGIGGFHLAADPSRPEAMARLRTAKERERKPFALMVRDIDEACALCVLSAEERALLASAESPIVIAPRRAGTPMHLTEVSRTDTLGVMLPYTPVHLLLLRHPDSRIGYRHLVMTSGNPASEPIVTDPAEARKKLEDVADLFLFHDRRIVFRTDDSIVRSSLSTKPFLLRRSRGFVPRLLELKEELPDTVLGLGGDLKSAPALAHGRSLHLCPFIGDLDDPETLSQFDAAIRQLLDLYQARPARIVHDMHPQYRSTRWALASDLGRAVAVQHHFAHALSVMAEHGLEEAIALCFDGTGFGTDGSIWGGEFLHATRSGFRRLGSFAPFPLPGGDAAVLNPPRIALAILGDAYLSEGVMDLTGLDGAQARLLFAMIEKGVNCPSTTSLGRIFDAAAAVLGLVEKVSYEGEGPILLEGKALGALKAGASADDAGRARDLLPLMPCDGMERIFLVDPKPLIRSLYAQRGTRPTGELALLFHRTVAWASVEGARRMREKTGISRIVLSGGVFQNMLLRDILVPHLKNEGFEVFLNEAAPPGDGGISVGQAWYQER